MGIIPIPSDGRVSPVLLLDSFIESGSQVRPQDCEKKEQELSTVGLEDVGEILNGVAWSDTVYGYGEAVEQVV